MQIVGIDCAAQDINLGLAYASGRTVEAVAARVTDAVGWVVERVDWEQPVLLALDAPLGWPGDMGPVLQSHEPGARIDFLPNRLFRRHSDRVVARVVGKHPLDIGADRIARTAHGALRVLDGIRRRAERELPLLWETGQDRESGVIEVYPAASRRTACLTRATRRIAPIMPPSEMSWWRGSPR